MAGSTELESQTIVDPEVDRERKRCELRWQRQWKFVVAADMLLKAVHILYNKIYGLLYWMYGRLLQISQSGASNAISSREGDIEMQLALIAG
ncbi:hypothetical protein CFP56_034798 [Quercus suber]|uniref:Uncharacterized protein n=1 Tax=Quercus suber TaxID=58331 RepID=A0AAW0LR72_QUESU